MLAFDFLGFGLSDKPRDHDYSLFWQADLTEELVRRHGDGRPVFIVAHDMGTSVATELMARDLEGKLGIELAGVLLFNGSMVLEGPARRRPAAAAQPARPARRPALQRALLPPPVRLGLLGGPPAHRRGGRGPVGADLPRRRPHPRPPARPLHGRARTHAERWHGAIRDWPGRSASPGACRTRWRRPPCSARCASSPGRAGDELPDLGHYPQLEDPGRVAAALRRRICDA